MSFCAFSIIRGNPSNSELDKRVISMSLEQLRKVGRAICIASGSRKFAAIRGALADGTNRCS